MFLLIFLFDQNITHAANNAAGRQAFFSYPVKNRIELEAKGLPAKRIKLHDEKIRFFFFEKRIEALLTNTFDVINCDFSARRGESFEIPVHPKLRKSELPDMSGQISGDRGPSGNQNDIVLF